MLRLQGVNSEYKNHSFPGEIISHGVWLYSRFTLSYRDVQELLFERGMTVSHEAVRQWCRKSLNLSQFVEDQNDLYTSQILLS
jgi:transposase-like protein